MNLITKFWLTFSLCLSHASLGKAKAAYCLPGDSCFPSTEVLKAFNASIGGRLLQPQPYGAACYQATYDGDMCRSLAQNKTVAEWRVEQPAAAQYPNMELDEHGNGCVIPDMQADGTSPIPVQADCTFGRMPQFLVNASSTEQVAKTVQFASKHNLRFRVKNTGHCYTGRSLGEGSFSVWTHNMRDIKLHRGFVPLHSNAAPQDVFSAGPGVTVEELYRAAGANGVAVVGGLSPTVGASGGWILGGGAGPFARHFGLGVDNVVQFEAVTSSGEIQIINDTLNPELFWALRGGGGAFAVITRVYIKAHPAMKAINTVVGSIQCQDKKSYAALVDELVELQFVLNQTGHSGAFSTEPSEYLAAVLSFDMYTEGETVGSESETLGLYDPVQAVKNCTSKLQTLQTTGPQSWLDTYDKAVLPLIEESVPVGHSLATVSRIVSEDLFHNSASRDEIKKYISEVPAPLIWQNTVAGVVKDIDPDATAVHPEWRRAFAFIDVSVFGDWEELSTERLALINSTSERLNAVFGSAVYYNEQYGTGEEWQHTQFGANYPRLLDIKHAVDPAQLFQCRNCVGSETGY
ncbi:hypothetical protein BKA59DRAFT_512812 [Fusarium tricinctum]|uniref:FAD-binding PCMH-type domain-containing protein n=1 Tax=Fusarium tricinctum TaxID=61284 RepID=A0A8K0W8X4_9HYPO|nr:hypothetical protein BKA59DRAFT_512812 [Fusarium tricinctum]